MGLSASDIRGATFPEARRGYEPAAVDGYLARIADDVAELCERLAEAIADEEVIKHTLGVATRAKNELLAEAVDSVVAMRAEAVQRADRMIASAEERVQGILAKARAEVGEMATAAEALVARSEAEADSVLAGARAEAEALVAAARHEAGEVNARAKSIRASACDEAEALVAAARTEAGRLLDAARAQTDDLAGRANIEQQVHQQRLAAARKAVAAVEAILSSVGDGTTTGFDEAKAQLTWAYHSLGQVPRPPAAAVTPSEHPVREPSTPPEAEPASGDAADGGEPITVMVGAKQDEAAHRATATATRRDSPAGPDPATIERRSYLMAALQSLAYD